MEFPVRDEWKSRVEMGYRFCPNCQRDYIRGNKQTPSWISPAGSKYRGCNNCGLPYNENPKDTIDYFFKHNCKGSVADHIHDVLAVQLSDLGVSKVIEFKKLVETVWIKDRRLYNSGMEIIAMAYIALTGDTQ